MHVIYLKLSSKCMPSDKHITLPTAVYARDDQICTRVCLHLSLRTCTYICVRDVCACVRAYIYIFVRCVLVMPRVRYEVKEGKIEEQERTKGTNTSEWEKDRDWSVNRQKKKISDEWEKMRLISEHRRRANRSKRKRTETINKSEWKRKRERALSANTVT